MEKYIERIEKLEKGYGHASEMRDRIQSLEHRCDENEQYHRRYFRSVGFEKAFSSEFRSFFPFFFKILFIYYFAKHFVVQYHLPLTSMDVVIFFA